MNNQNTLFILGAGASVPYGFPTSRSLRMDIVQSFSTRYMPLVLQNSNIKQDQADNQKKTAKEFQRKFNLSSIYSIDYFISRNPTYIEFGKNAILLHLLEFENKSKFREYTIIQNSDWYSYLYNYLISNSRKADSFPKISRNNISFLTFNYDRSLEHFLNQSLLNSFENINSQDIDQIMRNIPIEHIYGSISKLPQNNRTGVGYGSQIRYEDLANLRENIYTIGDTFRTSEHITDMIVEADRIFFLGFGFDKLNLWNLKIPQNLRPNQKIFATAFGLNNKFITDLRENFINEHYENQKKMFIPNPEKLDPHNLIFENVNALTLLEKYL